MALQVAILGPVEPRVDGDVVGVPAGKQRALLTLLAMRAPQPVSAEVAADALWPHAAPAEAMRSLQVTVSRLRRSLGAAGAALETVRVGISPRGRGRCDRRAALRDARRSGAGGAGGGRRGGGAAPAR